MARRPGVEHVHVLNVLQPRDHVSLQVRAVGAAGQRRGVGPRIAETSNIFRFFAFEEYFYRVIPNIQLP